MRKKTVFLALAMLLCIVKITNAANETIKVSDAWSWPTVRSAKTGAVYMKIRNDGNVTDSLLFITTDAAERTQIRARSIDDNGTIQMNEVKEILKISPSQTVELLPDGTHIALNGLKEPLQKGQKIDLVLQFKNAGTVNVTVTVMPSGFTPDKKGAP